MSPVAYLGVDESRPSDEGRFVRLRRKGSFVLLIEWRMSMATKIARMRSSWRSLTRAEHRRVAAMLTVILGVNVLGWGTFVLEILPRHFQYNELGVGIGVAVTAWTLGLRHAFDADHIAAIDNATRKLMADGQRPLGSGFFFALGHASVVMIVGVGITVAAKAVFGAVVTPHSTFASAGGVAGTALSATFLWLIAALNLVVLVGIARVFRDMRRGVYDEQELEAQLLSRGLMMRFFGRLMRSITNTRQLFFVGFVFGIGFDTATEVLLLAGTAAAVVQGLPWFAVLTLPLLFAGGMMLCDSIDGLFMNFAYGWAFARPVRKVYYNLTITALSVAVAFLVGGVEIVGLLSTELHLHGWFGDYLASFDLNTAGFIIVGLFAVVWTLALLIWRFGHVEARWEAAAARSRAASAAEQAR
jgi:high-affinity nickel-transport protein